MSPNAPQLEDNLGALATIARITDAVKAEIEAVLGNAPVVSGTKTMAMVDMRRDAVEAG